MVVEAGCQFKLQCLRRLLSLGWIIHLIKNRRIGHHRLIQITEEILIHGLHKSKREEIETI